MKNQRNKFGPVAILDLMKRMNDPDRENGSHNCPKWHIQQSRLFENISKSIMKQWLKFGPIDVFGLSKTSNGLDLDLGTHKIQKMNKKKMESTKFQPK